MIYFNSQLMQDDKQAKLFMVTNPIPFKNYEDHEAALYIRIYELIEDQAEIEPDYPVDRLIMDYLNIEFPSSGSIDLVAQYFFQTPHIQFSLGQLKENWDALDEQFPTDSILGKSSISKQEAHQIFSETDLRSYLETLSTILNV